MKSKKQANFLKDLLDFSHKRGKKKKTFDFLSLRGSIKSNKKYDDSELDETIGKAIAKEFEEENKSYKLQLK